MSDIVILGRDGVINCNSNGPIKSVEEWQPIPGGVEAIASLSSMGMTVVIATNQPGVNSGSFDLDDLEAIHEKLNNLVIEAGGKIAGIFYCPHTPKDNCNCRKPKTGLIEAIEKELGCSTHDAILVGHKMEDIQVALAKGCVPILVRTGRGQQTEKELSTSNIQERDLKKITIFPDLLSACDYIVRMASY